MRALLVLVTLILAGCTVPGVARDEIRLSPGKMAVTEFVVKSARNVSVTLDSAGAVDLDIWSDETETGDNWLDVEHLRTTMYLDPGRYDVTVECSPFEESGCTYRLRIE